MKEEAFAMKLKPGFADEYKKRHDAIWPELKKAISETADRAVSGTRMNAGGVEIDVSAFRIVNGEYLTAGQIDVLRALQKGEPVDEKDKAYIGALNAALERSGAKARIKYETGKGFELVTNDE